jgi:PAS domain S-box-containing protein
MVGKPEENLRQSEARLRRAQRVARLGSWELDLVTGTMWGSDEAFRIYGLEPSPDNTLPFDLVKLVPLPEYRPAMDQALRELFTLGRAYSMRFRIRRQKDGMVRHVSSFAEAMLDSQGKPMMATGTIQDVTEQEEAALALQAALKANEERALLILEQAADAIFLGDASGVFVGINLRACELTGYARDELLNRNISMLFSPQVLQSIPLRYDLLERGENVIQEWMLTRKDGSQVAVEMRAKKLSDGTLQAIVRDVSERKRLEEQLALRQRMDSVGTLASGIAHDFNNILAAIMGYADVLRLTTNTLSPMQQQSVENILSSSRRAADLVRSLQSLSRPAHGEMENFDLHKVANEVFHVLRETTDRMIAKDLLIERGRFSLHGHASALYHALLNLGINAIQAIEEKGAGKGGRVTLEARDYLAGDGDPLGLAAGPYVHVLVADTGVGMTPEVRRQAFDPLFTTKEKGQRKGQGLGLAMVYNTVVTQHHGIIHVDTAPGVGTTFHLNLPRATEEAQSTAAAPSTEGRGTETILIIDDEPLIVTLTRRVLERAGYSVLSAGDGQEGVEIFEQRQQDIALVLLDRSLPRLPGEQVMKRLRAMRPEVKVIVSSGDASVDATGFPGAARILHKPYTPSSLCGVIRELLNQTGSNP